MFDHDTRLVDAKLWQVLPNIKGPVCPFWHTDIRSLEPNARTKPDRLESFLLDIPATAFRPLGLVLSSLGLFMILLLAARRAPWQFVREHPHVYFGSIVFVAFIWLIRAGIGQGLGFHLLGAVLLTLMFGWELALIALTLIVSITIWRFELGLSGIAINVLFMGVLPIVLAQSLLWWAQRRLPANFFVFIFVNAFLAGALSMGVVIVTGGLLFSLTGLTETTYLQAEYLPFLPLLMLPEGVVTGMLTTVFVVYMPQWVRSFCDSHYLK